MGDIRIEVRLPLDDDGFFRRECPLCCKEFKVKPDEGELRSLAEAGINTYLLNEGVVDEPEDDGSEPVLRTCPYCGQEAPNGSWWTQEQLAYIHVHAYNIMADLMNEHFIRKMKRQFGQSGGLIQFSGQEMKKKEPWISPEENDMEVFDLPCCDQRMKVAEDWSGQVHCFFCGFPHEQEKARS